jgi:predicted MFS family arabinose efflux permease
MAMSLFVYGVGGGYQDVGLIAGLIVGAGLFCQLLAPTLQRRIGYRGIIVLVYTVNALLLLLLFWQRSLLAAYLLFPVIGALFTLPSLAWLTLAQATANPGQTGAATGFFRGTFDLTSVIYYLACGALSARFTVVPLLAGAAVVLLCLAFLTWRLTFLDAGAASQRLPRRGKSSPKQVS